MNQREQRRVIVLTQVVGGTLTVAGAAERMQLSERQVKRLLVGFRREGVAALVHGNRGRQPAHALSEETREEVRGLAMGKYAGFNQVHLTEQLGDGEGIALSRSSVRRILLAQGIHSPRTRRAPVHRSRRERRGQAGALVQIDASPHDWLEGRGPRLTLFAAIDDATGEVLALLFRAVEDAQGYFLLVRMIVTTHGRPLALSHDRHSIFRVSATREVTVAEQLAGEREPTQFGRLLDELGIESIAARSPQAKGRVERLFGTLQDRLVSVLRLTGATNEREANDCLGAFLGTFNGRFRVLAAEEGACYRSITAQPELDMFFCFKYQRTVGMDNTIRFGEHRLQLLPGLRRRSWARAAVEVQERLDGSLAVYYHGECLATTPAPPEASLLRARGGRRGSATAADAPVPIAPRPPLRRERATAKADGAKPGPHHPWKRGFQQRSDKITGQLE
ncbi:MAG TPA: ISNCY family transposase [Thermomicrobiales bacterium]